MERTEDSNCVGRRLWLLFKNGRDLVLTYMQQAENPSLYEGTGVRTFPLLSLMIHILYIKSLVCLCVTTGRREKWREKNKTSAGWRAFEVLKPRSWEWNPVPVYRGPKTEVLRAKYRGLETQVLRAKCSNTRLYCTSLCKNTAAATEEDEGEEGNCVFVWFVVFLFCLVVHLARDILSLIRLLLWSFRDFPSPFEVLWT
jgi:hypothetical protein